MVVTIEKLPAVESVHMCCGCDSVEMHVPVKAFIDGAPVTYPDGSEFTLMFQEESLDEVILEEVTRELKRRKLIPPYEGAPWP